MSISLQACNDYIEQFCLDIIDWQIVEDDRRQRYLNVANRTLADMFENLIIPDEAVYETANAFSITFNDTNRLQQHGIDTFSIVGLGSFEFRKPTVHNQGNLNLKDYVPKIAVDMINKANNIQNSDKRVRWTGV